MGRVVKLVLGNLFVFLAFVLVANLIAAAAFDLSDWWSDVKEKRDDRIDLPNFVDKQRAHQIFDETRQLETVYAPYVAWSRAPFSGGTVSIDKQGDRVHLPPGPGDRGHVRFFGGSTTWGTGVDDDHTIPALFNDLHPEWTVHNHGESGFQSRQELARLINLLHVGEPVDLVIFYDGYNDVRVLCQQDVDLIGHARQARLTSLVEGESLLSRSLTSGLSKLVADLRKATGRLQVAPSRCIEDPAYGEKIASLLLANWRTAREVARLSGADFLAVLQPAAAIGSPNLSHLADDAFSLDDYANLPDNKLSRGVDHKIVYPALFEAIAREQADWILDLTDAFDGDELIYMGPAHVTANGNQIIAERISQAVTGLLEARSQTVAD